MRRKHESDGIQFMLKYRKLFDFKLEFLLLCLTVGLSEGQWANDDRDFYNVGGGGYGSLYQGTPPVPTINGYGAVKQVNGYNVLDLEQISRDGNLQRYITSDNAYSSPNEYSNLKGDTDLYSNGYGNHKSNFGMTNAPHGRGYSNFRYGRSEATGFYGDGDTVSDGGYGNIDNYNDNEDRECTESNSNSCPGQSGYNYGASRKIMGATIMQPMATFAGSPQSGDKAFGQSGDGYGDFMSGQSRGLPIDNMRYMQNYGNGDGIGAYESGGYGNGGYGSNNYGFMNKNQINDADYYEIPSEFEQVNNNVNNNDNMFNAQNMKKYAEYLELINKKYGIEMPGVDGSTSSSDNMARTAVATIPPPPNIDPFGGAKNLIKPPEATLSNTENSYSNGNGNGVLTGYVTGNTNATQSTADCEKRSAGSQAEDGGYGSLRGSGGIGAGDSGYSSGYQGQQSPYGDNNNVDQWSSDCTNGSYSTMEKTVQESMQQQPITLPVISPGSIQTLTQQIRQLPSVFYLHSTDTDAVEEEQLLRKTYGLPLVAFYVNKMEQPQAVEKNLAQLTAFAKMPYLFICGTFIGSSVSGKEHIDNYHRNNQIPKLVEFVCSDKNKSKILRRRKKRPEKLAKLKKQ